MYKVTKDTVTRKFRQNPKKGRFHHGFEIKHCQETSQITVENPHILINNQLRCQSKAGQG